MTYKTVYSFSFLLMHGEAMLDWEFKVTEFHQVTEL